MNILNFLFGKKNKNTESITYPDAVLTVSATGEILYANDNLLELMQLSCEELEHLELLDLFDGGLNLVKELSKTHSSTVVKGKRPENTELFLDIKATKYYEGEEKITIALRDVTHNQKMLNKLLFEHEYLTKLSKNQNSFLARIYNELISPIHSIDGFSQAILEGLGGEVNEKQAKYLNIISKNSKQLLELVTSVVEYSKLESGMFEYSFKNTDVVTLLTNIFNEYKPKADEKKIILNFDLNALGKRTIYTDENVLKQAISLLIENSISSTDSGSIQLIVNHPEKEELESLGFEKLLDTDKTYLKVIVSDTGSGITTGDIDTIFDPYANIERFAAKKAIPKCLDFGIIKNLVRLMKGKIWATSENMNGSTFTFIIPIEKQVL